MIALKTITSSRYGTQISSLRWPRQFYMNCWKAAGALASPLGVTKAVRGWLAALFSETLMVPGSDQGRSRYTSLSHCAVKLNV